MMPARNFGIMIVLVALGCRTDATPATAARATLVPTPGVYDADVARDGRLAFAKYVDGKAAIYVANSDGTNAQRKSFGVWDADYVEWSPDGKWISFARDVGGNNDAVIVSADSGAEQLIAGSPAEESPAGWLSDA